MQHSHLVEMMTTSRVDIPGTSNLRDLGGYPTRDGRALRPRTLFRGEALAHPGPDVRRVALWQDGAVAQYRSLGLATVVDVRSAHEAALAPSAWAEPTGARLELVPIDEGGEGDATDYMRRLRAGTLRRFSAADLAEYYRRTVRTRARQIGSVLAIIAEPEAAPVLVHCAAGKDRTGLVVALLLEALGVRREVTVADYALTSVFRPNRVAAYAEQIVAAGVEPADVSALFEAPPEAMQLLLDGIDAEYGSTRTFLVEHAGLGPDTFDALRDRYLTSAGEPDADAPR